jgi:tRNA (cmo5U34)-methyltransferase
MMAIYHACLRASKHQASRGSDFWANRTFLMQEQPVDEDLNAIPGGWVFDKNVADHFDSHVRKSLPLYDEIQFMMAQLSDAYITPGGKIYDIGTATGETIARLQDRHRKLENVQYIGIENSLPMIDLAKAKCDPASVEFWHADISDVESFPDAQLIIAMCTLQFVPIENRLRIVRAIHDSLMPQGAFVMVEKLKIDTPDYQNIWKASYDGFKRRQGLTDEMIQQKEQSLEGVLVPMSFGQNLQLLREGGFSKIEPFFMWFNFCGVLAQKG